MKPPSARAVGLVVAYLFALSFAGAVSAVPTTFENLGDALNVGTVNQAYPAAPRVRLLDENSQPIVGENVTFTAPATGPSATLNGGLVEVVATDGNGEAQSSVPQANGELGDFAITATAGAASIDLAHSNRGSRIEYSRSVVDFGEVLANEFFSAEEVVVATNTGNDTATFSGLSVTGPFLGNTNPFGNPLPPCGSSLPAGGSCKFGVRPSSSPAGPLAGTIGLNGSFALDSPPVDLQGSAVLLSAIIGGSRIGSSVLVPYFEVDLDDPEGVDTTISLRNVSSTAIMGHVTLWSDVGIPVLAFNVYFTGYDVVDIDLRDVIVGGTLPRTASAGQDPADTISNKGGYSQDINFASCSGELPYPAEVLTPVTRAFLQAAFTGQSSPLDGQCYGFDHGDRIARGYVTVDMTNQCSQVLPTQPGYFASGGTGIATIQNHLAGEWFLTMPGRGVHAEPVVSLLGDTFGPLATPGNETFYGSFDGWEARDNRVALPGTWAIDAQAAATEVIVWRDTRAPRAARVPFSCALDYPPPPTDGIFPQTQEAVIAFDVVEQPTTAAPGATPFALATQRVVMGAGGLPAPAKPGLLYLGLNSASAVAAPVDLEGHQAHVSVLRFADGPEGGGAGAAVRLDRSGDRRHVHPQD